VGSLKPLAGSPNPGGATSSPWWTLGKPM